MIFIIKNGMFYCKDKKLREFVLFGTPRWTAKQYRSIGHAVRVARRFSGQVIKIPAGMKIEGSGRVVESIPSEEKPGYDTIRLHNMFEFIVPSSKVA